MKENKLEDLIWIIFTSVGIIFVLIGLTFLVTVFNYKNKINTKGIITEITRHNKNQEVYVSYIVEGKKYESRLNGYSFSFYEGKEIDIYYDKNNPYNIGSKSLDLLFLIFPGIGMIFLVIGGMGLLRKINLKKLEKYLKENGELIYGNYVQTVLNTSYSVLKKHPYYIICEWNDPLDNKRYIFKSRNIWINPQKIIEIQNIKQFPIYISTHSKNKYIVDINVLTHYIEDLR